MGGRRISQFKSLCRGILTTRTVLWNILKAQKCAENQWLSKVCQVFLFTLKQKLIMTRSLSKIAVKIMRINPTKIRGRDWLLSDRLARKDRNLIWGWVLTHQAKKYLIMSWKEVTWENNLKMTTILCKPQFNPPKIPINFKILTVRFCNCQLLTLVSETKRIWRPSLKDKSNTSKECIKNQSMVSKLTDALRWSILNNRTNKKNQNTIQEMRVSLKPISKTCSKLILGQ